MPGMKRIIVLIALLLLYAGVAHARKQQKQTVENGLYLIVRMDTTHTGSQRVTAQQKALHFSPLFEEYNGDEQTRIIIDCRDHVPLELRKAPETEQQTEQKKKLLLSLTPEASEKLKTFTTQHVMHMVAIVVDGEVLTTHRIKEALTSGQLQITRCNDNACERLYLSLKDHVKP